MDWRMTQSEALETLAEAALPAPDLTVVVPSYNERENVEPLVARLKAVLRETAFEIIFVDDNSPDGTADAVRAIGRRDGRVRCIRRVGRRGLAGACIEGMLAAQGSVVAVIDADLQHDETILPKLFSAVFSGEADLAVASRYMEGGNAESFSKMRGVGSKGATALSQKLLGVTLSDPMSGFFAIKRDIVEAVAPKLSSEGFKILLDIAASTKGALRTVEIPYVFGERVNGESKMDSRVVLDFIGLILSRATGNLLSPRFLMFVAVGLSGLLVHLLTLRGLLDLSMVPFAAAQAVATYVAMTTNYMLNNALTYKDRELSGTAFFKGLISFYAICSIGAMANVGVASWIFADEADWWLAGIAGALMGAVWNFVVSDLLIWRRKG
jgi:dolichol-phosphate mannosyltransferase